MSKAVTAYLIDPRTSLMVQLVAAMAAFWPVWIWYCQRTVDRSDEPLGVVALLTVSALIYLRKTPIRIEYASSESVCRNLAAVLSLVLLYCVLVPWAPQAVLAMIAISVVGICLFRAKTFGRPLPGDFVLLLLSVPLVASLNFYLGYPMRLIASFLAASMLNLGGLAVSAQGAEIVCNSSIVGIDQPCSGIKMLWVALYLAATLSRIFRFDALKTFNMLLLALVTAIIANAVRVSSLFYIETRIIDVGPDWHGLVHSGIGVATFVLLAGLLVVAATSRAIRGNLIAARTSRRSETANPDTYSGAKPLPVKQFLNKQIGFLVSFTVVCFIAASMPLTIKNTAVLVKENSFNWPRSFEGQKLTAVPLSALNLRFAEGFPGRIAVFRMNDSRIVYRIVNQPTRQLHASASCYKASGYKIKWLPELIDSNNQKWTVFEAVKNNERLLVRERFYDEQGNSWTDVSSWYWSAVLQQSRAPWWAVSIAKRMDSEN